MLVSKIGQTTGDLHIIIDKDHDPQTEFKGLSTIVNDKLETLAINGFDIRDLAPAMSLMYLRELRITRCDIRSIPALRFSESIELLDLSHNEVDVSSIAQSVSSGSLEFIRTLVLTHNYLPTVPDLTALPYLTTLTLDNNKLTGVAGIAGTAIESLNVDHNQLYEYGDIAQLPRLRHLSMAHNQLATTVDLPDTLATLDLRFNCIASATDLAELRDAPLLRDLLVEGNPLCDHPEYRLAVIYTVPQIETLDGVEIPIEDRVAAINYHENVMAHDLARDAGL